MNKDAMNQARNLSEALLVHSTASGWATEESLSQDTTESILSAFNLDGKDPLETALISQMLSCHYQAVQMMGKSGKATHPDTAERYLKLATQLMALYTKQTDSLLRYRSINQVQYQES